MNRFLVYTVIAIVGTMVAKFPTLAQCTSGSTATAATSGNWGGAPTQATWTFTGGITNPNQACTIFIPAGITVTIKSNTTWYGNVEVRGTLNLDNQLNLGTASVPSGCGLTLKIFGAGLLGGSGSSDRLIICGNTVVSGQPVPPAGAIDWPADGSFSAGDIGGSGGGFGSGGVLPVELIFFGLKKVGNEVIVSWATASEFNFHFFELERSVNGHDFLSIGKVDGHGTTNQRKDYQFVDELPLVGKSYYRLKSVDYDGFTEYFKIISLDFEGEKQFHLSPNPSDGLSISGKLNFTPSEIASVIVYDNVGSIVGRFEWVGHETTFGFPQQLKSGVYYAKYSSDDFTKVTRFLVKE